ncbi:hypothetical protein Fmac_012117 [Flemingia macrophylla]|uniref:Dirigent protein n=1 Tax=Flemingia macrophylla TaxID=520843 RepID=A0ABD1MPE0_9FABA
MVMNLALTQGKYNGSTIAIMGRNVLLNKVRELPVVGGSGLFRFAKGYAEAKTHSVDLKSGDSTIEYNSPTTVSATPPRSPPPSALAAEIAPSKRLSLRTPLHLPLHAFASAPPPPLCAQPERSNPRASTLGFPSSIYNFSSLCVRGPLQEVNSRALSSNPFCKVSRIIIKSSPSLLE